MVLTLVVIGWLYVALMMAVAEATNSTGSVLGAIFTFFLYGVIPIALVIYLLGRGTLRKMREQREQAAATAEQQPRSAEPDAGGEAPADAVAPVRKEP